MTKKLLLAAAVLGIIGYSLSGITSDDAAYAAQIQKLRREKNQAFRASPDSPLPAKQRPLDSLKYYAPDKSYCIRARLTRNARPDTVALQMSDNRAEPYLRWGQAAFFLPPRPAETVRALPIRLTLYRRAAGADAGLFVPFTDATNGRATYGGGRYLDLPLPAPDSTGLTLDFNQVYNPYCAYGEDYSCPVPPAENRLGEAIPAGEKAFHD